MISPTKSAKLQHLFDSRQKRVLPPVKCAPSNSCVPPAMAAVAVRIMDLDLSNDREVQQLAGLDLTTEI